MHELLDAVQRFLDTEIVPATEGRRQFLARVAANVVRMVDRELATREEHLPAEWERLNDLLGPEERPADLEALRAAIARRTAALCEQIRNGEADSGPYRERLVAHVRVTVREKLLVTNRAYLEG